MKTRPQVTFHPVKSNADKLKVISELVGEAFAAGQKILIAAPSPEAAAYIDRLLWRMPEESFVPHVVTAKPVQNRVVIAVNPTENLNQAHVLLNLSPTVSPMIDEFAVIRELFDETDAAKAEQSAQRQAHYQQAS